MQSLSFARASIRVAVTVVLFVLSVSAYAQTTYTPDVGNVGLPDNGMFSGGSIDTVQLNNGNLHIDIPLLHLPGIGQDTDIHLIYDSQIWNHVTGYTSPASTSEWTLITWARPPWQTKDPLSGSLKWGQHTISWNCQLITGGLGEGSGTNTDIDFMSFTDGDGTAHPLPVSGLFPSGPTPLCGVNGMVGGVANPGYDP